MPSPPHDVTGKAENPRLKRRNKSENMRMADWDIWRIGCSSKMWIWKDISSQKNVNRERGGCRTIGQQWGQLNHRHIFFRGNIPSSDGGNHQVSGPVDQLLNGEAKSWSHCTMLSSRWKQRSTALYPGFGCKSTIDQQVFELSFSEVGNYLHL